MKPVIAILIVLLLSSNAYWAYKLLDASVSLSYRDDQIKDMKQYQAGLEKFIVELARNKPIKKLLRLQNNQLEGSHTKRKIVYGLARLVLSLIWQENLRQ